MKRTVLTFFVLFFAVAFTMTMATGSVMAKEKSEKMTIVGKVEQGKIVADDGQQFTVADNAKGKELMTDHMGHRVEVKGKMEHKDGQDKLVVSSIKHLSNQ
jgi:hypothetical protein